MTYSPPPGDPWGPGAGPPGRAGGGARKPRRRRGARALARLLVLALLVGLWWSRSPDPAADLRALAEPRTYTEAADRISAVIEDLLAEPGPRAPVRVEPLTPLAGGGRGSPPPGRDEEGTRLAPAVPVDGTSTAYAFAELQDDGTGPVAWSPCRPVRFVVSEDGAPQGFAGTVRETVGEVSAATGLVFVDGGPVGEAASPERKAYLPEQYGDRWAPVLVAFADPQDVPYLEGDTAGVTYTYRVRGTSSGTWHIVSGSVYLDSGLLDLPPGLRGEPAWVAVLRHELGHLVGLDHLDDPTQLMNPVTSALVRTYQEGDLAGLAVLGRGACAPDV